MKEFKFCGEITEYVEIPVTIFESQKELVEQISGVIRDAKDLGMGEEESIYVIYKDGSKYFVYDEEEIGKFKRYGIKAAVYEHVNGYEVYGNFAVTGNGDISIEESDIEEYGVYAGQYDVKEQDEKEVQETVEQTVETIAEGTSEVETTEQAQAEENKDTFEYRNYIISGNERTGIIAIDNHGNFSPKVYKTVEEAKKAVDEDIEYAEKKYAEMEAEQTEVEETAETETEETIKTTAEQETVVGISKMEIPTETDDSEKRQLFNDYCAERRKKILDDVNSRVERAERFVNGGSTLCEKFTPEEYINRLQKYKHKAVNDFHCYVYAYRHSEGVKKAQAELKLFELYHEFRALKKCIEIVKTAI